MQTKALCLIVVCLATFQALISMSNADAMIVVQEEKEGRSFRSLSELKVNATETNEQEEDEEQQEDDSVSLLARDSGKRNIIAACNGMQVRQEGCDTKHMLWVIPSNIEARFGTQAGLGNEFLRFPLNIAQIGSKNQLYWEDFGKYYIIFSDNNSLGGVQKVSKAAWFHITPGNRLKTSRKVKGKRRYYFFKSDRNYCTNDFKIDLDINERVGKYIIVEGCVP